MMGSLMGCSFESLVIDNEALGMVLRAVRGIEVTDETLSLEVIKEHVIDPGHFLGCGQTLEYMESEYLYPTLMDRASAGAWENEGSKDVFERGRETSRAILGSHYPDYLGASVDRAIRERFPIRIESAGMSVSGGRWQA
jgi:trimethylamine--corrinoid protein Co-methyltransferase